MPRLQGLIFDLEGTLLDSTWDLRQAVNLTLAQHGRRPLTLEEVREMTGDGALAFIQRAFAVTGEMPVGDMFPYAQQFIANYRNIKADHEQIYPYVVPTLEKYSKAGIKLGICTNKPEAATIRVLEELDLCKYFTFIAGGDTFPVHKPNPEHLLGVIRALGISPKSCVFVGDSKGDVRAAHGAGIPCIVVTHAFKTKNIEDLQADGVISGFEDLPKILFTLGFQDI